MGKKSNGTHTASPVPSGRTNSKQPVGRNSSPGPRAVLDAKDVKSIGRTSLGADTPWSTARSEKWKNQKRDNLGRWSI